MKLNGLRTNPELDESMDANDVLDCARKLAEVIDPKKVSKEDVLSDIKEYPGRLTKRTRMVLEKIIEGIYAEQY